jgi:hypothetical protein
MTTKYVRFTKAFSDVDIISVFLFDDGNFGETTNAYDLVPFEVANTDAKIPQLEHGTAIWIEIILNDFEERRYEHQYRASTYISRRIRRSKHLS